MKRKLPHFRFPGFKILDRYILGKFLSTYFFAIAMIIVVVVIFDYVEKIDDFTELHAPLKSVILDYYLNFIPYFINQFSGLFTFIACIFFTSKMAYQTEIVAMLTVGCRLCRAMRHPCPGKGAASHSHIRARRAACPAHDLSARSLPLSF